MIGLFGGWRLEQWSVIRDANRREYPMGPDARGYILYTPGGQVSATIMRADASACFAYAGCFQLADSTVLHTIEVSTDPALIGVRSTRHIELEGDRLTLSGPDFVPGTGRTQKIVWRRA